MATIHDLLTPAQRLEFIQCQAARALQNANCDEYRKLWQRLLLEWLAQVEPRRVA